MSVERLAALIRDHQPCVALTGAGVSTESGIPDFRSPSGIWAQFDPMEYATIDASRSRTASRYFVTFSSPVSLYYLVWAVSGAA